MMSVLLVATWTTVVSVSAYLYGMLASRHLVGPLVTLTTSLRQFDPSLGQAGHPVLVEVDDEPEETAALRRALRQAVDRIARDRAQKEAVLAGLMHDLKTPLVAQLLLVAQLERADARSREDVVRGLEQSSNGAVMRLNRLIDVLRVDSPALTERTEFDDLSAIAARVVDGLQPLIRTSGVEVAITGSWSPSVEREGTMRALENVVGNALRHARSRVSVELVPGVVRVTDDGPGFSRPFSDLLDPFRPGPANGEQRAGTAGLGLYIARRSLEATGGRLKLETSRPGFTAVLLYPGLAHR